MVEGEVVLLAAAGPVVAEPAVALDAPMPGTPAGRGSAAVPAVPVEVVDRMAGAGLVLEFERAYPAPDPALLANHARSEYSRLPGPSSGCHNMDNA